MFSFIRRLFRRRAHPLIEQPYLGYIRSRKHNKHSESMRRF